MSGRAPSKVGARLTRLRNELCSDSFHAVLAWSCGRAKCQCCIATVMVVVYIICLKILPENENRKVRNRRRKRNAGCRLMFLYFCTKMENLHYFSSHVWPFLKVHSLDLNIGLLTEAKVLAVPNSWNIVECFPFFYFI